MTPKLVTFDCADTLVGVAENWSLGQFAADCARHVGLHVTVGDADTYQRLYMGRLREFVAVNMCGDNKLREAFWEQLASDWLTSMEQSLEFIHPMRAAADELGFGENSILFSLFDDVVPCLDYLDSNGIKAGVISNWDYSLHRVLRMFGIYERFVVIVASLEKGVEKPDPRLFEIALREAGFTAEETLHVGDSVEDDFAGARNAAIRPVLIDRNAEVTAPPFIRTLRDLPEAFEWID